MSKRAQVPFLASVGAAALMLIPFTQQPLLLGVLLLLKMPESVRFMVASGQHVDKVRATLARISRDALNAGSFAMTEAAPQTSMRYRIRSIPTMALFRHGQEIARTSGAMSSADIQRWVRSHLD